MGIKPILGPAGGGAIIPAEGHTALITVEGVDPKREYALFVLNVEGGIGANNQMVQDLQGDIYYVLFGQRVTTYRLACMSLPNLCGSAQGIGPGAVGNILKNSLLKGTLPGISITYDGLVLKGYLLSVTFNTTHASSKFDITVAGRYI